LVKNEIMSRLIYEMDEGKPIYYKKAKGYLEETKHPLISVPDNNFQAWLKMEIAFFSRQFFKNNKYFISTNNLRFLEKENLWFISDVVIFDKGNFFLNSQSTKILPKIIFKIDSKEESNNFLETRKRQKREINQLINLGVEKIIWIYSDAQIVKIRTPKKNEILDWDNEIPITKDFSINIQKIVDDYHNSLDSEE